MSTPIVLQPAQAVDSPYEWALGFALTLESISEYAEIHNGPFGRPKLDGPFLDCLHEWTETAMWMGKDFTRLCGGNKVDIILCYPRHPRPPRMTVDDSGVPIILPPATASTASPSDTASSTLKPKVSTTYDVEFKSEEFFEADLIAVVTVARIQVNTMLEAAQVLWRVYGDANKPYPLQRHWKTIEKRLGLPEVLKYPRLYQMWDPHVGPVPPVETRTSTA